MEHSSLPRIDADLLGEFVGNELPDRASAPGIRRGDLVLFEFGELETTFRIAVAGSGFAFEIRDRGTAWQLAWFNRLEDAARFVLLREGSRRNPVSWFNGLASVPDGIDVLGDELGMVLRWETDGEEHVVRALADDSTTHVCQLAWVRHCSLPEVIAIVTSDDPGHRVGGLPADAVSGITCRTPRRPRNEDDIVWRSGRRGGRERPTRPDELAGPALTRESAATIIAEAGLERGVWFERPTGMPDVVAIYEVDGGYRVVSTDERAVEVGQRDYEHESDALEMFLELLRDLNDLIASGTVR